MAGDPGDLQDGDSFMERHILDSTGFIELITFLEEAFGIKVEDDDMVPENLDSLDKIDIFLRKKMQPESPISDLTRQEAVTSMTLNEHV